MCNLSTGILEEGIEKGIGIGVEKGREEGILQSIEKMMKKKSMTFEEAADILEIPTEDYAKYKKLLESK